MESKQMIRIGVALLALSTCCLAPGLLAGQTAETNKAALSLNNGEDLFGGNTVIAKGKGVEVKRGQLDQATMGIRTGALARGQTIPPDDMLRLEQQVLERMIQIQLLLARATDADRAKGKESCDKRFDDIKMR